MHADNGRVDHLYSRVMGARQRVYNFAPDARPPPANEAIVAGGVRTEVVWQIAPRCPRSQDPEDAIEDTTVIHPRHAAGLVGQHRLNSSPFVVGKFIAHDSKLPSLGLESQACSPPQRTFCRAQSQVTSGPSGHESGGKTCRIGRK